MLRTFLTFGGCGVDEVDVPYNDANPVEPEYLEHVPIIAHELLAGQSRLVTRGVAAPGPEVLAAAVVRP